MRSRKTPVGVWLKTQPTNYNCTLGFASLSPNAILEPCAPASNSLAEMEDERQGGQGRGLRNSIEPRESGSRISFGSSTALALNASTDERRGADLSTGIITRTPSTLDDIIAHIRELLSKLELPPELHVKTNVFDFEHLRLSLPRSERASKQEDRRRQGSVCPTYERLEQAALAMQVQVHIPRLDAWVSCSG